MNKESKQPTILPWHREAAHRLHGHIYTAGHADRDDLAAIIARHDPHAETLRLLEDAKEYLHELRGEWSWKENTGPRNTKALADLDARIEAIRAHLAAQGGGK